MSYSKNGHFRNELATMKFTDGDSYVASWSKSAESRAVLSDIPKSSHYRDELEPLIGKRICCEGTIDELKQVKYGKLMILTGVNAVRVPPSVGLDASFLRDIDHICCLVSDDFDMSENTRVRVTAFVYVYASRGRKNIGLKVLSIAKTEE